MDGREGCREQASAIAMERVKRGGRRAEGHTTAGRASLLHRASDMVASDGRKCAACDGSDSNSLRSFISFFSVLVLIFVRDVCLPLQLRQIQKASTPEWRFFVRLTAFQCFILLRRPSWVGICTCSSTHTTCETRSRICSGLSKSTTATTVFWPHLR